MGRTGSDTPLISDLADRCRNIVVAPFAAEGREAALRWSLSPVNSPRAVHPRASDKAEDPSFGQPRFHPISGSLSDNPSGLGHFDSSPPTATTLHIFVATAFSLANYPRATQPRQTSSSSHPALAGSLKSHPFSSLFLVTARPNTLAKLLAGGVVSIPYRLEAA
ncbi:hypothetical protein QR685DRAFT_569649 [Neurospora intermedia]|uniref:Uncharacterized protein n=1 Tax=Neurospora intermedia TaxID=5142 RepID=A0ABR3DP80_NEUIN